MPNTRDIWRSSPTGGLTGLHSQLVLNRFMADKGTAKTHREIVDEEHDPWSLEKTRGFRQLATTNETGIFSSLGGA